MSILSVLIWNVILPASVASSVIALSRRLGRSSQGGLRGRWGVSAGLCLGYLSGHLGVLGWPRFPLIDAAGRLFWLVLLGGLLGMIEAAWIVPRWVSWSARGLLCSVLLFALIGPQIEGERFLPMVLAWLPALWLLAMFSWWNFEAQAVRLSGPGWVVPLILISLGWSSAGFLGGGTILGQLGAIFTSVFVGALASLGFRPGLALSKGGPAVTSIGFSGLALIGYLESRIPALVGMLLFLTMLCPWIDRIGPIRRRSYWTRASIRFLVVLLWVGLALLLEDAWTGRPLDDRVEF